jgi:capsular polysaccharide biosynthesis protein
MLNEAALIERLRPLGFDIVEPQCLTAAAQIAAFAAADLVVGPSGSRMFNAVFCRPGTKLIRHRIRTALDLSTLLSVRLVRPAIRDF